MEFVSLGIVRVVVRRLVAGEAEDSGQRRLVGLGFGRRITHYLQGLGFVGPQREVLRAGDSVLSVLWSSKGSSRLVNSLFFEMHFNHPDNG